MSYASAVDHLYALGHELAPATPGPPRLFFPLFLSPEPTVKAPLPLRSRAFLPQPATEQVSTRRPTSSGSMSAFRSTVIPSPTKTLPAFTSAWTRRPVNSSNQAIFHTLPASSRSLPH